MADIKNVEIMAAGTWNGHKITEETLQNIVDAFNATKDMAKPVLKLGHNMEQKLLAADGLPAAGWVSNVYIKGQKLLADFTDIPTKIFELIKKKAYRKVSVEIFSGYQFQGKKYPTLLGAVALLGADLPAVANLNDILSQYSLTCETFAFDENTDKIKTNITLDIGEETVAEKQTNEQNESSEALKVELSRLKNEVESMKTDKEKVVASFKEYKDKTDAKLSNLEFERNKALVDNFCLELTNKNLLSPSMKPLVEALASEGVKTKTVFSVGDKNLTTEQALTELLSLARDLKDIGTKTLTSNTKPAPKDEDEAHLKAMTEYLEANPNATARAAYTYAVNKSAKKG